jgi:hypothetical protein
MTELALRTGAINLGQGFPDTDGPAGMLPIALSLTGDASWRAPMGVTVIGGLIFSTILTLLLVPAYFSIAIDMEVWFAKHFTRLVGTGAHSTNRAEALPAE